MKKYGVRLLKNKLYPLNVPKDFDIQHGDMILILTEKGEEAAKVELIPCCVLKKWDKKLPQPLDVVRKLTKEEIEYLKTLEKEETDAYIKCNELISQHNLPMRLVHVKFTFDKRKITFYFTAPNRVDFRNLLKDLTQIFRRVRIDLRHIGVRDETSILEGVGLCGKGLCCSSWLSNFNSINIKLAKDQGMPINPSKISGVCGRLLCCLNYEYQNYIDAAVGMPPVGSGVMTPDGIGRVSSLHFLNGKVAVKLEDGKIKDYEKKDIEMIDDDITGIEIDSPQPSYTDEEESMDISQLEYDDDQGFTNNL